VTDALAPEPDRAATSADDWRGWEALPLIWPEPVALLAEPVAWPEAAARPTVAAVAPAVAPEPVAAVAPAVGPEPVAAEPANGWLPYARDDQLVAHLSRSGRQHRVRSSVLLAVAAVLLGLLLAAAVGLLTAAVVVAINHAVNATG
jgi:hypothetical protein